MVVALSGEIDIVSAPAARELLAEAASQAVTGITVDLSEVTYMDAAGLGVLAGANRATRHLPGGLRLVAVPARILRLLTLTGLDLPAFPCRPAASLSASAGCGTAENGSAAQAAVAAPGPVLPASQPAATLVTLDPSGR